MRDLACLSLFVLGAAGSTAVDECVTRMKADANPQYTDYCVDRCSLWGSNYGAAFCGPDVATVGAILVGCVYKMEGAACYRDGVPTPSPTTTPAYTTRSNSVATTPAATTPPNTTTPITQNPLTQQAIAQCESKMKTQVLPLNVDYCVDRCAYWAVEGADDCGAAVALSSASLIGCLYKMEGDTCYHKQRETTTAATTPALTTPHPTPAPTTAATTPAPTLPTNAATTTAMTTTTSTPTTTTHATQPTTTSSAPTSTTSTKAHEQYGPGFWSPDDAPDAAVTGPTGPNGECVWSWAGDGVAGGTYAGVGNKVYKSKYWADANEKPGMSSVWDYVTDCLGTAPSAMTVEEMAGLATDPSKPTMFYDPWTPLMPSKSEVRAIEAKVAQDEGVKVLIEAVAVLDHASVNAITPGRAANPENVRRVESFVTSETWEKLFPFRHVAYSYENFLKAVGAFPNYCRSYTDGRNSDSICKKLVAASFAHYSQETGANAPAWTLNMNDCPPENTHEEARKYFDPDTPIPRYLQGLYWLRETSFSGSNAETITTSAYERCDPVSDQPWSIVFPCSESVTYFGRGSKQLSWNFNYGLFSKAMFDDTTVLLNDPRQVAETWLNFASGIWFAVTPQSPKPPMVWALDGTWKKNAIDSAAGLAPGFGATIEIINGGYECRSGSTTPQAANRIESYQNFMKLFGLEIPADEPNDCAGSKGFPTNSPVSTQFYWNKDWSKPYTCTQAAVQSPFTVVTPNDYQRCVDFYWRSHVLLNGKEIIKNGDTVN